MIEMGNPKLVFKMWENGIHSFEIGLNSLNSYQKSRNAKLLKESLLSIHHGIELLMKEVLIRKNELLIFSNVQDAARKKKTAREKQTDIFSLKNFPKTVSFRDAIDRVNALFEPDGFDKDIFDNLLDLNKYRNQLQHFAIEVDIDVILKLLNNLITPIIIFFKDNLSDLKTQLSTLKRLLEHKTSVILNEGQFFEKEVYNIIDLLRGKKIPGNLLNALSKKIEIPNFSKIIREMRIDEPRVILDIVGVSEKEKWVIEVKSGKRKASSVINQILFYKNIMPNAQFWLIFDGEIDKEFSDLFRKKDIFCTGKKELEKIKEILEL